MKGKDLLEYQRQRRKHQSDLFRKAFDYRRDDLFQLCPPPWVLDQDNSKGVCVKDNIGQIVFFDDFSEPPPEIPAYIVGDAILRSRMLAHFLVEFSESQLEEMR